MGWSDEDVLQLEDSLGKDLIEDRICDYVDDISELCFKWRRGDMALETIEQKVSDSLKAVYQEGMFNQDNYTLRIGQEEFDRAT